MRNTYTLLMEHWLLLRADTSFKVVSFAPVLARHAICGRQLYGMEVQYAFHGSQHSLICLLLVLNYYSCVCSLF
jgi:hypothetical protein